MSGQDFAWSWTNAPASQAQSAPDAETIIGLHECKRAMEELTAKSQKVVSDAAADPALVNTLRAAAWASAGHEVRLVRPASVGDAWDFDQRDCHHRPDRGPPSPV